jgi:hypothetical protein
MDAQMATWPMSPGLSASYFPFTKGLLRSSMRFIAGDRVMERTCLDQARSQLVAVTSEP